MALEKILEDLIDALDRNTKAHTAGAAGGGKEEREERGPRASERRSGGEGRERASDRGASEERSSSRRGSDDKRGPTEADLKDKVAKFLDQPSGKDGDAEYNKRLEKVIDPIFEKAGVKELPDLPEKYWQDLLDAIAEYEKPAEGGRSRSRR